MKLKRTAMSLGLAVALVMSMSVGAFALEYEIEAPAATEYYKATDYENIYGAQYNFGGLNAAGATLPELPYGKSSNTSIGVMERGDPPIPAIRGAGVPAAAVPGEEFTSVMPPTLPGYTEVPPAVQTKFTAARDVLRSDGSIGTLKISSLGINVKVYDGETAESMKKGVGHFTATSAWNGNIGICGHNRGAAYVIGNIKNLSVGNKIQYATTQGTRTYSVTTVARISSTDWSYLEATSDNRITLITCVANEPALRWCVQAIQVN